MNLKQRQLVVMIIREWEMFSTKSSSSLLHPVQDKVPDSVSQWKRKFPERGWCLSMYRVLKLPSGKLEPQNWHQLSVGQEHFGIFCFPSPISSAWELVHCRLMTFSWEFTLQTGALQGSHFQPLGLVQDPNTPGVSIRPQAMNPRACSWRRGISLL